MRIKAFILLAFVTIFAHAADDAKHLIEVRSDGEAHEVVFVGVACPYLEEYMGVEISSALPQEKKIQMSCKIRDYLGFF